MKQHDESGGRVLKSKNAQEIFVDTLSQNIHGYSVPRKRRTEGLHG